MVSVLALGAALGCCPIWGVPAPPRSLLEEVVEKHDALALSDALEGLIAEGKDTPRDRQFAYDEVKKLEERSVAYTFARAAITGRLVQQKGLSAAGLVEEVERFATRSREMDANFRDGAATRMLGTLYVLAPAALLEHGDSEKGLDLLEALTKKRPDVVENHLRLAEAYIALGDPKPGVPHLCIAVKGRDKLRRDERALLDKLVKDIEGGLACPNDAPPPKLPLP